MSSGKKPPEIKAPQIPSTSFKSRFGNREFQNMDLDGFVFSFSRPETYLYTDAKGKKRQAGMLSTQTKLAPDLENIRSELTGGLRENSAFLGKTPTQQLDELNAGNNPYFNLQKTINDKLTRNLTGEAENRFAGAGLENSTVRGAYQAQLANDAILRDLATRGEALEYQNRQALENASLQQSILGDLASLLQLPAATTTENSIRSMIAGDNARRANAELAHQRAMAQAQLDADAALENYLQNQRRSEQGRRLKQGLTANAGISALKKLGMPF